MTATPEQNQICKTIIYQLGGEGRLKAMAGLSHWYINDKGNLILYFKGSKKCNIAEISLNGKDLYDMEFFKVELNARRAGIHQPANVDRVAYFLDVYCEDIRRFFKDATGLTLEF